MLIKIITGKSCHLTDKVIRWCTRPRAFIGYFALLNALYLLWLAGLKLTAAESADVLKWWHASSLWQALQHALPVFPSDQMVVAAGAAVELSAGLCLLAYRRRAALRWGALLACLVYGFNLLYLLTNPIWVASMGGFPFLGAGQGYIKYVPMLATSMYLFAQTTQRRQRLEGTAVALAWLGIVLVMGWIGSMKFFLFEAHGIEPLLRHHWLFSWMYGVWDVQGVSNVIGATELLFALLVALSAVWRPLLPFALAGIAVTVACTTSFMFTLPGWAPTDHFPLLNGAGVFLLKDQFLLAATLLLFRMHLDGASIAYVWRSPQQTA